MAKKWDIGRKFRENRRRQSYFQGPTLGPDPIGSMPSSLDFEGLSENLYGGSKYLYINDIKFIIPVINKFSKI
jgi:hypothetical protein